MKDSAPKIGIAQLNTFHCYLVVVNQFFSVVDWIWGNIYAAWWFTLCHNINSQLFQWPYMVQTGKDGLFFSLFFLDYFPDQFLDFFVFILFDKISHLLLVCVQQKWFKRWYFIHQLLDFFVTKEWRFREIFSISSPSILHFSRTSQ